MIINMPTSFDLWAQREGYDTAPAVSPSPIRQYADRDTQAAFDAWKAGSEHEKEIACAS